MAKLEDLIKQIPDAKLRAEVAREVATLKSAKKFGLVFEDHIPEQVQLPSLSVQKGARVVKRGNGKQVFQVLEIEDDTARLAPEPEGQEETARLDELVVIKNFGEAIYPSLTPRARIERAPDKPWHTIINADNFHALQLLLYCYEGMVDVIYIDPPYNTGAKDWKYNNDFVDGSDQFRHSKWLSMMKKRLELSKRLLNENGVLIVTIDEHEVLNLGVLLREVFPNTDQQLVTIISNPGGSFGSNLSNVNEFAFFVIPDGKDFVKGRPIQSQSKLFGGNEQDELVLERLRKRGNGSLREDRKNMFYAVYVEKDTLIPKFVGDVIPFGEEPSFQEVDFCIPIYPIDEKNIERRWNYGRETMMSEVSKGKIVAQRDNKGIIKLYKNRPVKKIKRLNTVWTASEYAAGDYGSRIVNSIFGKPNAFPFPKSIYAVRDSIGSVCVDRKKALILDFFAGSGTTLHATCLLNQEDDGERTCILVTNNEVDEKQAKLLLEDGFWPGDQEFERNGICESITFPRCKYVINGKRDDGTEFSGTYLNGREMKDGFEENLEYFRLDFLDSQEVAYGEKFEAILPILWLMSGAQGKREDDKGEKAWFIPENSPFAVLINEHAFTEFKQVVEKRTDLTHIFLVTDSMGAYLSMLAQLPDTFKTKMLYKSYLDNFKINIEQNL